MRWVLAIGVALTSAAIQASAQECAEVFATGQSTSTPSGAMAAGAAGKATSRAIFVRVPPLAPFPGAREHTEPRGALLQAMGCFWKPQHVLSKMDGVVATRVGYIGGKPAPRAPTYREVCSDETGHAEAVEVVFDPTRLTYPQLLSWFFSSHDPTTLNRQGPDHGSQYRSAIFYVDDEQRAAATRAKEEAQARSSRPVVTEIVAAPEFFAAEDYHQHYIAKKRGEKLPSCAF
jgi:peptide-methionine (S)-S-oxide reductase